MRRVVLFFLLLAFESHSNTNGIVWLENPLCGGILIEPRVVLSLATCLGPQSKISWPYRSEIAYSVKHPDSVLALLVSERDLPDPVELIRNNPYLGMNIRFSNLEQSKANWIDVLENTKFDMFDGLEPPLKGSPVLTTLESGETRVVGMVTGEKTALRLDPYFSFIDAETKKARDRKIILPAKVVTAQIPAVVVNSEAVPIAPVPTPAPATMRPPESLGCACSQVR